MATKKRSTQPSKKSLANEVLAVVLGAAAVLLMLSLITYDPKDPNWNNAGSRPEPANLIGILGAYISETFLQLFGVASFVLPILIVIIAARIFFSEEAKVPVLKAAGATALLFAFSGFIALFPKAGLSYLERTSSNGGLVGYKLAESLSGLLNSFGAGIVLAVVSVLTLILTMEFSLVDFVDWIQSRKKPDSATQKSRQTMFERLKAWWAEQMAQRHTRIEERRALRAETLKRTEDERRLREREERRLERERKPIIQERLGYDDNRLKATPVAKAHSAEDTSGVKAIPITKTLTRAAGAGSGEGALLKAEPAAELFDPDTNNFEDEAVESPRVGATTRREMAAVIAERTAKREKRTVSVADQIAMDPEVAEMTSTAWIERTTPAEKAGVANKPARENVRRKVESNYALPPIDILEVPIAHREQAEDELRERAIILAEKCKEFSVVGHIHRINPGPVVTTFEFKPDPGIKYSRVVGLADDLCLALKAESIRIDRIPGKSTVGIEAPNLHREKIFLRDVIESPKFQQSESKLTIALGKTINGEEYIADLSKMPHLLIAGATGAGKSVTLNALVCSILYKASPDEVKFIMVDPKRVELGLYEGIPHLLTPIVTDPKRAANALKWAVNEMESRYRNLAGLGVRNIEQYNRQIRDMKQPDPPEDGSEPLAPLPYIVIAIDELADLMMVARSEVETSIARLAQMARAVGIHLVLATQRPSVDIITGVIKANIPSRIAFRVSQKVDSRTIIDSNGAEALLGQGDMLFLPPASARLIRVHGSFVNEDEVKKITDHTRKQAEPQYNEQVTMSEQEAEDTEGFVGERDELYEQALAIVTDMGRASTSVLQRRLSIGYGRAAKILDMMEREGFIGPAEGAKPRKVLKAAYEFRERLQQQLDEEEDF